MKIIIKTEITIRKEWNTAVSQRETSAGFSLSLKCERRQQVAALRSRLFPPKQKGDAFGIPFYFGGKSGIRSATITTFTCFFAYLYLTHFSLFCRYHAGVANNRFIGCLVGSLFRKNGYPLRADFQPVRIPRLTKKNSDTL